MLGTQVVGLVQEAVLGAAKPGLGMGTQVPQVVVTVGLHEVLEGLGDPAGEGSSQLKPQLLPGLYPVHPLLKNLGFYGGKSLVWIFKNLRVEWEVIGQNLRQC